MNTGMTLESSLHLASPWPSLCCSARVALTPHCDEERAAAKNVSLVACYGQPFQSLPTFPETMLLLPNETNSMSTLLADEVSVWDRQMP